jgi:lysophospholipase L1-like esterase
MANPLTRWLVLALLFVRIGVAAQTHRFSFDPVTAQRGETPVLPSMAYTEKSGYGFDFGTTPSSPPFYFSIRLPEGNYNIIVTVGDHTRPTVTTIKAENRRLMVERLTTKAGESKKILFTVHLRDSIIRRHGVPDTVVRLKPREYAYLHWDNKLTLEFGDTAAAVQAIEVQPALRTLQIFLAGNSTVVDQAEEPWAAWGQMIPAFFQPGLVVIANYAESGETLKAFTAERRLAKLFSMAHPGDYLFIEFAHNDQKPGSNHLDPYTTYKDELSRYIGEARSRGMIPVLVTSMHRRNFDSAGHIVNTLGEYPAAMREEAKEQNVPLIDLNAMSKQLYEAWGPEQSIHAFVHYPAHTFPGQDQELKDDTHFNAYGAYELAKCVVNGIKANIPALVGRLYPNLPTFDPTHPDPLAGFHLPMSRKITIHKPDGN